ncbi:unnamed protein product [Paramecium octaurelia]|uniref:RBR-type E3 ubiquitin transferase n=1 Tax=Paramecium octaurelia TaxID=43137 RepID=A0A8S1Y8S1_PAROT|nr:unnamed protein product [Paramecium octaurelia]
MDNINLNVDVGEIAEPEQIKYTMSDSQKELILKLHTEYQIPLIATIYVVIYKDCQTIESANELYKNIVPSDHDFIQYNESVDCAICKQQDSSHKVCHLNYSTLINMADEIQNKNTTKIVCSICFEGKAEDNIARFNNKIHNICEQCFTMNLMIQIQSGRVQDLKCPHCSELLSDEIILKYAKEVKEKYLKFKNNISVATSTDRMWCPNNQCLKIVIFQTSGNFEKCTFCQTEFCKICRQKSHPDINCNENLKQFIGIPQNNERLVQCPRCKFLVEKIDGCSQITCSYCKCQWCWGCCKEITFLHPFYCPHFMPCYDEKVFWTKFLLIFWYFYLLLCLFLVGLFFGQIMLFQCMQETRLYENSKCWLQVVLNILIGILGIIILPLTTAMYLVSIIPLCIGFIILDWHDGQTLKKQRLNSNVQQVEP